MTLRHVLLALLSVLLVRLPAVAQPSTEIVLEWNQVLRTALATPGAHPANVSVTRPFAIMHVAIFDALNAFDPRFVPYLPGVVVTSNASADAAVAQAAHDVLSALMPTQAAVFQRQLAATLERIDPQSAAAGSAVGSTAARAILQARANDSWNRGAGAYRLAPLPGYWQPTPPNNANATFVRYPNVLGFIITNARGLLVESPPALVSSRYAADFNEVKALGGVDSTQRTAEQTQVARLWAAVGTRTDAVAAWNIAMTDVARTQRLTALDAARMFALANMTAHDALKASFTSKFRYALWRPVTAIREAARDGNPDTEADPAWTPLVVTPSYPTYPGNMACLGAAFARAAARVLNRDDVNVSITWPMNSGEPVTRTYAGLRQIADELARSRQFAGVNFQFDNLSSFGVCTGLADYAADNYLRQR
jgi:hypothetical protein